MYAFIGKHFLTSYVHCSSRALADCAQLKREMIQAAEEAGAQVLDVIDYRFEGGGYTLLFFYWRKVMPAFIRILKLMPVLSIFLLAAITVCRGVV